MDDACPKPKRSSSERTTRRLRIVSGGQTGVDRAALLVAMELRLPCGGWCPRGRKATDGPIDIDIPLQETPSTTYAERTRWNVLDSDATLILAAEPLTGGTRLTRQLADSCRRPVRVCDPAGQTSIEDIGLWIVESQIRTLNIAGPRERHRGNVEQVATEWLRELLRRFV